LKRAPSTRGRGLAGAYSAHALLTGFFLFPLLFMLVSAFKSDELQLLRDMGSLRAFIPCGELSLRNFTGVFAHSSFLPALANSWSSSAGSCAARPPAESRAGPTQR